MTGIPAEPKAMDVFFEEEGMPVSRGMPSSVFSDRYTGLGK